MIKHNNDIHENYINNHNSINDKNKVIRMMIIITVPVIIIIVGNIWKHYSHNNDDNP